MIMNMEVTCKKSKKGNLYLSGERNGKTALVTLVKDGKRYEPKLKEGNSYDLEFTSYAYGKNEDDSLNKGIITLFNVSGI